MSFSSRGLGHYPLTVVTWIRIPQKTFFINILNLFLIFYNNVFDLFLIIIYPINIHGNMQLTFAANAIFIVPDNNL